MQFAALVQSRAYVEAVVRIHTEQFDRPAPDRSQSNDDVPLRPLVRRVLFKDRASFGLQHSHYVNGRNVLVILAAFFRREFSFVAPFGEFVNASLSLLVSSEVNDLPRCFGG